MLKQKKDDIVIIENRIKVGFIRKNSFFMVKDFSKHFYKSLNSWCINYNVYKRLPSTVTSIWIITDTCFFNINISKIKSLMQYLNLFITNNSDERQLAIPSKFWDYYEKKESYLNEHSSSNIIYPDSIGMSVQNFLSNEELSMKWKDRILQKYGLQYKFEFFGE